jgi:enoyl-CoA hydratase/carnithine racemase
MGATARLAAAVGKGRAMEMLLTGTRMGAVEAAAAGLAARRPRGARAARGAGRRRARGVLLGAGRGDD